MSLTTAEFELQHVVSLEQGAPLHSTLWSEDSPGKHVFFYLFFVLSLVSPTQPATMSGP